MTQTHEDTGQHAGHGPHESQEAYRGLWQWGEGYPYDNYNLSAEQLPLLKEGTCSAPTSDAARPLEWFYWRFVPTQSGFLSFDGVESFLDDPGDLDPDAIPEVEISIWVNQGDDTDPYWNDIDYSYDYYDDARDIWIYRGRILTEVEAGRTYVLGLRQNSTPGFYTPVNLVLRIGDEYTGWSDWVQPPDQVTVWSGADANHPQSTAITADGTDYLAGYGIENGSSILQWWSGFEGKFRLSRTFGGPFPATDPEAIKCTWRWSRVLQDGWAWWDDAAPYTGPGQINDWFGWVGGPGVCPTFGAGDYDSDQYYGDRPVGYHYSSESPNQYQECGFRAFATAQRIHLVEVENVLTRTGTARSYEAPYLPELGEYEEIEWEPVTPYDPLSGTGGEIGTCKLMKVELAPDERLNGGSAMTNGMNVTTKWYVEQAKLDSEIVGRWGPHGGYDGHSWVGGPQGPESFVATQTHLADYNGGLAPWQEIPESMWRPAMERERLAGDGSVNPGFALLLTGIPDGLLSNDIPSAFNETLLGAMGVSYYHYRQYQFVAMRTTVRPVRYRIRHDPGLPNVTWKRRGNTGEGLTDGRIFR